MNKSLRKRSLVLALCGALATASVGITPALAAGHGGFGGHVGGFGHAGGIHGGYGGFRGGYGRGGYGWHGGYGYRGWGWGPWGWGLGALGLGLYVSTLPYYYTTYWWGGVPYYYADNVYYRWDSQVGQYQTVQPPAELAGQNGQPAEATGASGLIAYPKNGQSDEQQSKDKFECHQWAASQTGFDPTQANGGSSGGKRGDYARAQAACLEGRGYSVR